MAQLAAVRTPFIDARFMRLHELFGLPGDAQQTIRDCAVGLDLHARPVSARERDAYIREMLDLIQSPRIERSEAENHAAWERGWQQNLIEARAAGFAPHTLKPKYFRGNRFLRYQGDLLISDNPQIEYDLFVIARQLLFNAFLQRPHTIYEIGCGSCNNLWMLSELFPDARIVGLDWVAPAVQLANELGQATGRSIEGRRFNMLDPDPTVTLEPGSVVVSIHALEQLGTRHEALVEWLIAAKPSLVLHYEPILEFYDRENVIDYLAAWYSEKRNYLAGFWPRIEACEQEGRVDIVDARRPGLGGVYHEASVIAWRPAGQQ